MPRHCLVLSCWVVKWCHGRITTAQRVAYGIIRLPHLLKLLSRLFCYLQPINSSRASFSSRQNLEGDPLSNWLTAISILGCLLAFWFAHTSFKQRGKFWLLLPCVLGVQGSFMAGWLSTGSSLTHASLDSCFSSPTGWSQQARRKADSHGDWLLSASCFVEASPDNPLNFAFSQDQMVRRGQTYRMNKWDWRAWMCVWEERNEWAAKPQWLGWEVLSVSAMEGESSGIWNATDSKPAWYMR